MTFSIRTTIRALVSPKHRITCPRHLWTEVLNELNRRGEGVHEAGVFLLGVEKRGKLEVKDVIFYDDLDPSAYDTGVCVLHGNAFAMLWARCRERALTVVADAHTHGGAARQSYDDRTNPMVARAGHIAIIVPNLAAPPARHSTLGIYEYCGAHNWRNRSGSSAKRFFYVGLWS
jgi:hypothetical protein